MRGDATELAESGLRHARPATSGRLGLLSVNKTTQGCLIHGWVLKGLAYLRVCLSICRSHGSASEPARRRHQFTLARFA